MASIGLTIAQDTVNALRESIGEFGNGLFAKGLDEKEVFMGLQFGVLNYAAELEIDYLANNGYTPDDQMQYRQDLVVEMAKTIRRLSVERLGAH